MENTIHHAARGAALLIGSLILFACGSGSVTGNVTAPSSASLQSISNIPDLNVDALDAASSSANIAAVPKGLKTHLTNPNTTYARSGCETRACVDEFKTQVKEFNGNKCIMEAMETHTTFSVGNGSYNYFKVLLPPEVEIGELANTQYRVKVGVVSDKLGLFLCQERGGTATQTMAMNYQVSDGKFVGQVTDQWPSFQESGATDGFRVSVNLNTEDLSKLSDGDTGTLSGQFNGFWGSGSIQLDIAKKSDVITNVVDAAFQSGGESSAWGQFTSLVYGKYDAHEGCAKFSATGSYPGQVVAHVFSSSEDLATIQANLGLGPLDRFCWKEADPAAADSVDDWIKAASANGTCSFTEEGSECFTFSTVGSSLTAYVYDTASATYYPDIVDRQLGSFTAPTISFAGDETWDCTSPGDSWDSIDVTSNAALLAAVNTCFESFQDANASRNINSCEELERERDAESDTGGSFSGE